MARTRTRTWGDSEVKRAVDAIGGEKFAAAHCNATTESVVQWLIAGTVPKDKAPILARAALAQGVRVDLLKMLYGNAPELEPFMPTAKAGKGVRMPRNSRWNGARPALRLSAPTARLVVNA